MLVRKLVDTSAERLVLFLRPKKLICATLLTAFVILNSGCNQRSTDVGSKPEVLDSFVGQYKPDSDTVVTITREGTHLSVQVNHQASIAIFPESEDIFVHKESGT